MKRTWYVIQVGHGLFLAGLDFSDDVARTILTPEIDSASQYRLPVARRVVREHLADNGASKQGASRQGASRFPRIIKITQETKTIKEG